MPKVSLATLKTYFEAGDKPTEAQFVDLLDSLKHKDYTDEVVVGFSSTTSIAIEHNQTQPRQFTVYSEGGTLITPTSVVDDGNEATITLGTAASGKVIYRNR